MAKNVFRAADVQYVRQYFNLKGSDVGPQELLVEQEAVEQPVQYSGPSADELRLEAEQMRANLEEQRNALREAAEREAQDIVTAARTEADTLLENAREEARIVEKSADEKVENLLADVKKQAEEIIAAAETRAAESEAAGLAKGLEEGRSKGYDEGRAEMERLVGRLHTIVAKILARRREILNGAEQQVVQLVLLVARKVIKVVSAEHEGIVRHNIVAALRKLRAKSDIIVRVNIEDLQIATQNKKEFIALAEKVGNITIAEDSTIARGGCIIETDIGEIDARIDSQLRLIEDRIKELVPFGSGAI